MIGAYAEHAWTYRRAGWAGVLPLPAGEKWPPPGGYTGWAGADPSGADVQAWCDGSEGAGNVALRLPHDVYGLDVDDYGGKSGGAALARLVGEHGPLPATWVVGSRVESVSGIRLFRVEPITSWGRRWADEPGGHGAGIEAIHYGHRYAVVAPSLHPEGRKYVWRRPDGMVAATDEVPKPWTLPVLPITWMAALSQEGEARTGDQAGHVETVDAVRGMREGEACTRVREAAARGCARLREARDGAALHPAGRDATHELVALGWEGHVGVRAALAAHHDLFIGVREARAGARADGEAEWWRLVRGAVGKMPTGTPPMSACDCALWAGEGLGFEFEREAASDDVSGGEVGVGGDDAGMPTWEAMHAEEINIAGTRIRVDDTARDLYGAFKHARDWSTPKAHGPLHQELLIPDTEPRWRIEGMLGNGHNAILVAGRKTGKTTMINDLIRSYVDGDDFLGTQPVTTTGRGIAVFNYEVDERQYRRWLRDVGIEHADRVHLLHLRGKTLPLVTPRVRAWVTAWLADRDIGLWVLDPYSRAYIGSVDNSNSESEVSVFLDALDVVKADAGVSELVMPVHSPKARVEDGSETAIGSQRLEGWPDAMWFLTRDGRQRYLRAEGRDIEVNEKQLNYDSNARRLSFDQFGTDRRAARDRAKVEKQAAEQAADLSKLIGFIRADPGCTTNTIRDGGMGFSSSKIGSLVGLSSGRIVIESGANRSKMHFLKEHFDPPTPVSILGGTVGLDQLVPLASHSPTHGVSGGGTTPEGGSPHPPPPPGGIAGSPDPLAFDPFDLDGADHAQTQA